MLVLPLLRQSYSFISQMLNYGVLKKANPPFKVLQKKIRELTVHLIFRFNISPYDAVLQVFQSP